MMLEAFVSEQSARMVAMKSAKDNAKELMGDLILLRNKIRQASITKEVIEIISSAEALKG
jgi:F-type H+-transporting ATPase subunit gamma